MGFTTLIGIGFGLMIIGIITIYYGNYKGVDGWESIRYEKIHEIGGLIIAISVGVLLLGLLIALLG